MIFLFPAGVFLCFRELRDEHVFVIIYAVVGSYFAGVMVRLMLTLTPVVCVTAAIAMSTLLDRYINPVEPDVDTGAQVAPAPSEDPNNATLKPEPSKPSPATPAKKSKKAATPSAPVSNSIEDVVSNIFPAGLSSRLNRKSVGIFGVDTRAVVLFINAIFLLVTFVSHCTWMTSTAYSSPSVVLASKNPDGSQHIIDDFREAYYWLRQNTPKTAVVMSWWDYGYQIAGFADRPTLVDNNTWNNSEPFYNRIESRIN